MTDPRFVPFVGVVVDSVVVDSVVFSVDLAG
jgi:hypothetical protein